MSCSIIIEQTLFICKAHERNVSVIREPDDNGPVSFWLTTQLTMIQIYIPIIGKEIVERGGAEPPLSLLSLPFPYKGRGRG